MPYVFRNEQNEITGICVHSQFPGMEYFEEDSPEIIWARKCLNDPDLRLPLQEWAEKQCKKIDIKVKEYAELHYEPHRQMTLQKLLTDAKLSNKQPAIDYISQVWTWMTQVFSFYYYYEDMIMNIVTDNNKTDTQKYDEINNILNNIDLTIYDAADPIVTIRQSMVLLMS